MSTQAGRGARAILSISIGCLLASAALGAGEEGRPVSIPSGDLGGALDAFAHQYGVEILYRSDQVRNERTQGVSGTMPAQVAVEKLLEGTALRVRRDPSGAMLVALPAAANGNAGVQQPLRLAQAGAAIPVAAAAAGSIEGEIELEEIVVVGSQIKGAEVGALLPVTVLNAEDIAATGAVSGDELFRSLPQAGAVAFNESRTTGGINDARGDVASINLRALGTGNTLVLLNGRRLVLHPGTQAENLVPVTSVNTNALPVMGIQRLEVLRDGASAIYGTDAVAGVVNTVLRRDFKGFTGEVEYGGSEGTSLREMTAVGQFGMDFNDGHSNLSVFASYYDRDGMPAADRRYSASADLRPLFEGTPFAGDLSLDNRSTSTPWGAFTTVTGTRVSQNGTNLTSASGVFHIQPTGNAGCLTSVGTGICIDDGPITAAADRNLRYDVNAGRTAASDGKRANLFSFFNHEFDNGVELFSEMGYYDAQTVGSREQASPLSAARITVPTSNYYNPFGATTLPDGSPNPNRLPGLNVPDAGMALTITGYRPIDTPNRRIVVDDDSYRLLGGVRYAFGNWDFESAGLYSEAQTADRTSNRISSTLFQQALALSTPDAYNPFNGGDPNNVATNDSTPSNAATINSFLIDVSRVSETSLALWDAKLSNRGLLSLPAGALGLAMGVEWRHEAFSDDRDPRLDGTITYTDMVTGDVSLSDVMGSSPTLDTSGHRHVVSAFAEAAVPIVSESMEIPLMKSFDVQLAARFEDYSDVGDVLKPKFAFGWQMFEWMRFRGAYSQGFRAPNLPQVFETGLERVNTRSDWIRCEADLRSQGTAFADCDRTQAVSSSRTGSRTLKPENDDNYSFGVVFTPSFAPTLTLSADYWRIEQQRIVGIFGDDNQIALDYLLRVRGSSNPNVIRAAPDADDIAAFAGTGLTPVGDIISVNDNYRNLLPRTVEGVDFGMLYRLNGTGAGNFSFGLNAARLIKFYQDPSPQAAMIIAAQQSGEINATAFSVSGAADLIEDGDRPKWRSTASVGWQLNNWSASVFASYVGRVFDNNLTLADGTPYEIEDWLTASVYGQYSFAAGVLQDTTLRLGVRNVTDEDPPLVDDSFGYSGDLHSNRGRYWYLSVRHKF